MNEIEQLARIAVNDLNMVRAICQDRAMYKANDGQFRYALHNLFQWAQEHLTEAQVNELRGVYLSAMEAQ